MKTLYLCLATFFSMLAIDVLATKKPEEDVLDLLKKEKFMAQAEHHACAAAISESQQATASKVEATVKAVKEAEMKAEMAMKEMTMIKVQMDSITVMQNDDSFMFAGPLYDEWVKYKDTGGTSDFEYYRLYKK
jgi:hypothetical protein